MKESKQSLIEKEYNKPVKDILDEYERFMTPLSIVARELGVHVQTIYYWRRKIGYKKRK